jgi:hypothetical protein
VLFIRLTIRLRSLTSFSRSRFGRLASSSSSVGIHRHVAVTRLAAPPAEEGALQKLGIEPVRLRPAMLARHGDTRRVDHVSFDAPSPQPPASQKPSRPAS